jgi:hypothetical protein
MGQSHCFEPDSSSYSQRPSHQAMAEGRQKRQHRQHCFDRGCQRIHFRYVVKKGRAIVKHARPRTCSNTPSQVPRTPQASTA